MQGTMSHWEGEQTACLLSEMHMNKGICEDSMLVESCWLKDIYRFWGVCCFLLIHHYFSFVLKDFNMCKITYCL